jgi:hypothetical protein
MALGAASAEVMEGGGVNVITSDKIMARAGALF